MTQLRKEKGFTLVEMMIVVAILSIVALGLSSYMLNLTKQQKHAQENMDMMQLNAQFNAASVDAASIYQSATITN